jgi:hypothetical protein
MDRLEEKREAEAMAQLSFCFEVASSEKYNSAVSGGEADSIPGRAVGDATPIRNIVLNFPQNRSSSGSQAQLIQRMLQRYRFF